MLQRRSRRFAVVLEEQCIAQTRVLLQVNYTIPERPEEIFNALLVHIAERRHMIGRFDDHFMSTDPGHLVVEAFAFALQVALHAQGGELVGDYPQRPAGFVRASIGPVCQNFGRCFRFMPGAERAETPALGYNLFPCEIGWPFGAVGSNDDPSARDRVLTKFRQIANPPYIGAI